jgi:hypothetical protein
MYIPNRLATSLIVGTMLTAGLLASPVHAQRTAVGNASVVVGDVTLDNDTLRRPREISRRDRIAWGDLVATARRSQLQILLLDRSSYGIGARSSIRIDRHVYDPNGGSSTVVTFIRGALRYFSGRQDNGNQTEIRTPSGRIGVRGTALDLLVGNDAEDIADDIDAVGNVNSNDDEATLVTLRGPGANTAGGLTLGLVEVEAAGVTVVLDQPGQASYIPRNGAPPIGPFMIPDAALAAMQEELAPEVARANSGGGGFFETLLGIGIGAIVVGTILSGDDDDDSNYNGPTNNNNQNNPDINERPPYNPD